MSEKNKNTVREELTAEQWLQIRKEEGLKIDPESAAVMWSYEQVMDPYGVYQLLPEEECIGSRVYLRVLQEVTFGSVSTFCLK